MDEAWIQKLEQAIKLIEELMIGQPLKLQRELETCSQILEEIKEDVK